MSKRKDISFDFEIIPNSSFYFEKINEVYYYKSLNSLDIYPSYNQASYDQEVDLFLHEFNYFARVNIYNIEEIVFQKIKTNFLDLYHFGFKKIKFDSCNIKEIYYPLSIEEVVIV